MQYKNENAFSFLVQNYYEILSEPYTKNSICNRIILNFNVPQSDEIINHLFKQSHTAKK